MPKRFSRLKYALRTLNTSANFDNPPAGGVAAPTGSVLEDFQNSVKNQNFGNITRTAGSLPGSAKKVNIQPFGLAQTADNIINVGISGRSAAKVDTTLTTAKLNHLSTAGKRREGFQPAKAILNDLSSAAAITSPASATKTSQITGIKYKYKGSGSYTFPFGAGSTATTSREEEVIQELIAKANSLGVDRIITFKSERT